jgi:cyclopropane fatty-acyl-phospholipid synthase-like methyltransferase
LAKKLAENVELERGDRVLAAGCGAGSELHFYFDE